MWTHLHAVQTVWHIVLPKRHQHHKLSWVCYRESHFILLWQQLMEIWGTLQVPLYYLNILLSLLYPYSLSVTACLYALYNKLLILKKITLWLVFPLLVIYSHASGKEKKKRKIMTLRKVVIHDNLYTFHYLYNNPTYLFWVTTHNLVISSCAFNKRKEK